MEWGFGEIKSIFGFLDFDKEHKIMKNAVGKYFVVAALLFNLRVCLYRNKTSLHFDCPPPSVYEYVNHQ